MNRNILYRANARAAGVRIMLMAGCAAIGALSLIPAAQAQTAEPEAEASETETVATSESGGVEEIIVTARRRSENLQSVPVAVTALTSEALDKRDVRSLLDIARYSPSLTLESGGGANGGTLAAAISIRGVGQLKAQPVSDPAVGIYVDGVYLGRVVGSVLGVVDAERIEVLRGPQGTLYGKNTLGGAINITSKLPNGDFGGYVDLGYGLHDERNVKGAVEFPVAANFAARLSFSSRQHDGYDKNITTGDDMGSLDVLGARLVTHWTPSSNFRLTMSLDGTRERDSGLALHPREITPLPQNLIGQYNLFVSGALTGGVGAIDSRYVIPGRTSLSDGSSLSSFSNELDAWGVSAKAEWDILPDATLTSITGYRWMKSHVGSDVDGTPILYNDNDIRDRQDQFSQELHLGGEMFGGRLKWLVGAYFADETVSDQIKVVKAPGAPVGFSVLQNIAVKNTSYAVFTQETLKLFGGLSLTAGIRYSDEKKDAVASSVSLSGPGGFPETPLIGKWSSTTPRVSLEYAPNDDFLAYISYTEGFKSGGINYILLSPTDLTLFDPEHTEAWEAGIKAQFLDRRVRLNLAAFRTNYRDYQFEHFFFTPTVCGGQIFFCSSTLNAAEARIKGVEMELTVAPGNGLSFFANGSYIHNKIVKLDQELIDLAQFDPTVITLDTKLPRTPKWQLTAGFDYSTALGSAGELNLHADVSYRSLSHMDTSNVRSVSQPGYALVNARIAFVSADRRWELALSGANLTDKLYISNGTGTLLASDGYSFASYGAPRTITASVKMRFGSER